ncbi:MAG: histidine kinase [Ferruginibacter sp.]
MYKPAFYIPFFLILLPLVSMAQFEQRNFRHYTFKDGLCSNKLTGIIQDSIGYIWLGSHQGLNRFDGSVFKKIQHTNSTPSIIDNDIKNLKLLHGNKTGILTASGVQLMSAKDLSSINLVIPAAPEINYWANLCKDVKQDAAGNYGVSTKTGLYIFNPGGNLVSRYDYYTPKDIGRSWMMFGWQLFVLPDGSLMQETEKGLLFYNSANGLFTQKHKAYPGLDYVHAALQLTPGNKLYALTTGKFILVNKTLNEIELADIQFGKQAAFKMPFNVEKEVDAFSRFCKLNDSTWALCSMNNGFFIIQYNSEKNLITCDGIKHFTGMHCTFLFTDRDNRVWIGTDEGLFCENKNKHVIQSAEISSENLNGLHHNIIAVSGSKNKLFVAQSNHSITVLEQGSKKEIKKIDFSFAPVNNLFLKNPDTLWLGTEKGLWWMNVNDYRFGKVKAAAKSKEIENSRLYFFHKDINNDVWMAPVEINKLLLYHTATNKVEVIDDSAPNKLLKVNRAFCFADDWNGNVWIGGDAFVRWNRQSRQIDTLIEKLPQQHNTKKGFAVAGDEHGNIWVIVNSDGVARLGKSGPVLHLREENKLPGDNVYTYPFIKNNKFFLPTENLLGVLDINTLACNNFGYADGLPDKAITMEGFYYDTGSRATYMGFGNLLCWITDSALQKQLQPPVVFISEIHILSDTTLYNPGKSITLPYFNNDIRLSISAVNYTDAINMRYAYQLLNKGDSTWTEIGTQQSILFNNLSFGINTIRVKVYSLNNLWPEQVTEIFITVNPPFWKTKMFLIGCSVLAALIIYLLVRRRITAIRKTAALNQQLSEYEMKALHAQMNPHFIFNCLNSIKEMILTGEKEKASKYLSTFAQLLRDTLEQSIHSFTTLDATINHLERYISIEQLRFDNFHYSINTDSSLDIKQIKIPPMLLQPLVENAIWHGLQLKEGKKQLTISFKQQQQELLCMIEDNGVGFRQSLKNKKTDNDHHSIAVQNINKRIELLNEKFSMQYKLVISDKSEIPGDDSSGTIAALTVPLDIE